MINDENINNMEDAVDNDMNGYATDDDIYYELMTISDYLNNMRIKLIDMVNKHKAVENKNS